MDPMVEAPDKGHIWDRDLKVWTIFIYILVKWEKPKNTKIHGDGK